jgi:hypothetical protein
MATRKTVKSGFKSTRFYTVDGRDLPSVTSILSILDKPALLPWAAGLAAKYAYAHPTDDHEAGAKAAAAHYREMSQEAMDIGTRVHALADQYLATGNMGDTKDDSDQVVTAALALLQWLDEAKYKSISGEKTVYSLVHGYAGTLDQAGTLDGEPVIMDFKTCGKLPATAYPEVHLQLCAYSRALREMSNIDISKLVVIYLSRDSGEFRTFELTDDDETFAAFLSAKNLWAWKNGR